MWWEKKMGNLVIAGNIYSHGPNIFREIIWCTLQLMQKQKKKKKKVQKTVGFEIKV